VPRLSLKNYKYLVLRTNDKNGKSYEGFQWNTKIGGITKCSDWDPEPRCGNGLHGLLNGCGDYLNNPQYLETQWMVCGINEYVDLENKVKFPEAVTLYVGGRKGASEYLDTHGCHGMPVYYALRTAGNHGMLIAGDHGMLIAGDHGMLIAGDDSTLTAGDDSTLTAGDDSTLTAGYDSMLTAGYHGTLTAGDHGTLTAGNHGTLTAGDGSTLTAGDYSTLTAGDYSTLTADYRSTLTAGDDSTLTAGDDSTLKAGIYSILSVRYWDGNCYRLATTYVGEDGIQPNVPYRFNRDTKKFEEVK
jgi:hypothetical protein